MTKKSSASSRPGKLVRRSAENIFAKPLTKRQRADLEKLRRMGDSAIDFSDIPELTEEQLAQATRARPPKKLIAARLDPDVVDWLKSLGTGEQGYSSHINAILRAVMAERKRRAS